MSRSLERESIQKKWKDTRQLRESDGNKRGIVFEKNTPPEMEVMDAQSKPRNWISDDDVLLRKAVEAGASLECLAKSAVQFSQRFTVQELQARWYSLLYDPVVSEKAASDMVVFERSTLLNQPRKMEPESINDHTRRSKKRKAESVRDCYYAMSKRTSNEIMDDHFLPEPNNFHFGDDNLPLPGELSFEKPILNHLGGNHAIATKDHSIRDAVTPSLTAEHCYISECNEDDISLGLDQIGYPGFFSSKGSHLNVSNDYLEHKGTGSPTHGHSSLQEMPIQLVDTGPLQQGGPHSDSLLPPILVGDFPEISDSDLLFLDFHAGDDYFVDCLNSILIWDSFSMNEDAYGANSMHRNEVSLPPTQLFGLEYVNGIICCTLNMEDSDIPSNEDVPLRASSLLKDSTGKDDAKNLKEKPGVKLDFPESTIQHVERTTAGDCEHPLKTNRNDTKNLREKSQVRFECPETAIQDVEHTNTSSRKSSLVKNVDGKTLVSSYLTKHIRGSSVITEKMNNGLSSSKQWQERLLSIPSDQDFDVPFFEDVESMVLNMELSSDTFDLLSHPAVIEYQHDESKRTIIRLEQAADACMQRLIASRAAFAVLYSRSERHFIVKPEVLLGRRTGEVDVDIDLAREGGCKISRRQAMIKMEMNGLFDLHNLGKCSIYVNGNEVSTGSTITLTSCCLIEIREMRYVFETNPVQVTQNLDSILKKSS